MTQVVHATITLTLPEEGKEQAAALSKMAAEWAKLVHSLEGCETTFAVGILPPIEQTPSGPVLRRRRRHRRVRPPLAELDDQPVEPAEAA